MARHDPDLFWRVEWSVQCMTVRMIRSLILFSLLASLPARALDDESLAAIGRKIWQSLPAMKRTRELADVVAFFETTPAAATG